MKGDGAKSLGAYPSKVKPGEGKGAVEKVERDKKQCQSHLKELNNLWAPLKLKRIFKPEEWLVASSSPERAAANLQLTWPSFGCLSRCISA